MEQLLSSAIASFGYAPKAADSTRTRIGRGIVMEWACDMGVSACTEPALKDFNKWLNDKDRFADHNI